MDLGYKILLAVGGILFAFCYPKSAISADAWPEPMKTSDLGKRIDDPSSQPDEAVFSFHSGRVTDGGELQVVGLYDPGKTHHVIVSCYLGESGDSLFPFVDRFELVVHGGDGREQVVSLSKANVDPNAGTMPRLYDIFIPRLGAVPKGDLSALAFAVSESSLTQSVLEKGKLRFPITVSLRFVVSVADENGLPTGELQNVQTEKCTLSEDGSKRIHLKQEGRSHVKTQIIRSALKSDMP